MCYNTVHHVKSKNNIYSECKGDHKYCTMLRAYYGILKKRTVVYISFEKFDTIV